jgi:hypothetical protein
MEKLIKKLKLKYPKGFVVDIKKFESGLDGWGSKFYLITIFIFLQYPIIY